MAGMEAICARCGEELKPEAKEPYSEPVVSQGLCEQCSYHLLAQKGMPLLEYLDGLGAPVAVVDGDRRVRAANKQLCGLLHQDLSSIEGKRGGEVFECAYAQLPEGCGQTIHCSACAAKRTVMETYHTGVSRERVPACLQEGTPDNPRRVELLISTERIANYVLVRIDMLDGRQLVD
jgi:hypothetical protein